MTDPIPPTGRIADGLYLVSFGFVAMYVYEAGSELIAFDTGLSANAARRGFARLGLDPARVTHIFFTHSDPDHVGGLKTFPTARVFLSRDEVAMIDRTTPRFLTFIYNKPFVASYETLTNGQKVRVGMATVECIATPGHTAGSMSFLINGAHLIVGDILNISQGKATMDRRAINIDNEMREKSIRIIADVPGVQTLCPMHSGYARDYATAMADWHA